MVTCWAVAPAIGAAVIALPAGMVLQNAVMHAIASDQATAPGGLGVAPASLEHVYTPRRAHPPRPGRAGHRRRRRARARHMGRRIHNHHRPACRIADPAIPIPESPDPALSATHTTITFRARL
jgi:hypothetical protein